MFPVGGTAKDISMITGFSENASLGSKNACFFSQFSVMIDSFNNLFKYETPTVTSSSALQVTRNGDSNDHD